MANKTINQLDAVVGVNSAREVPVYDASSGVPHTRKTTEEAIAALNDVAIAAALAAGTNAGAAATQAQTDATQALSDAADAQNDATTALANAATAQTTANNAIPLTQKATANGVATLDGTGKVPAAQINISGFNYQNSWNATTNTPALADGVGTVGDVYIVGVGGSRNLGSGVIVFSVNDTVIYNGTVWQRFPAVGVGVTSVNGDSGPVVNFDADGIGSGVINVFVTPDMYDGLANAGNAINALNPAVDEATLAAAITSAQQLTTNELDSIHNAQGALSSTNVLISTQALASALSGFSVIASGNGQYYVQAQEKNGIKAGDGTLRTLASLGYSTPTANAAFPLTASLRGSINVNTTSYANVVWQEALFDAFLSNRWRNLSTYDNSPFIFAGPPIIIPNAKSSPTNNTDSQQFKIDFNNQLLFDQSGLGQPLFLKEPLNQTDADTNCIDNRFEFCNAKIRGTSVTGSIGMKIGATRSASFSRIEYQNWDIGQQTGFCLNAEYNTVNTASCNVGMKIAPGWWSGAGTATAGNQALVQNCRYRMTSTAQIGLQLYAVDSTTVSKCTLEGTNALVGIDIDVLGATVSKNTIIENTHIEAGGAVKFTDSVVRFTGREYGTLVLDTAFNQAGATNTVLVNATNTQGTTIIRMENCRPNNGGSTWKLRNKNTGGASGWIFNNTLLQGQPSTAADVVNTGSFPDIWTVDSDIPPVGRIQFNKALV